MLGLNFEGYKMTYRFNASHSIRENQEHTHTFWVKLYIKRDITSFVEFITYEKEIRKYFEQYRKKYINDCDRFKEIKPTLENMCIVFFKDISAIFEGIDAYTLLKLELGDNPTKSVSVGTVVISGNSDIMIHNSLYNEYLREKILNNEKNN